MIEYDTIFDKEINKTFNKPTIPVNDDYTPEMMKNTYLNMKLAIPRDGNKYEFSKVAKYLRDSNILHMGHAHDNQLLNTQVYEVEYEDTTFLICRMDTEIRRICFFIMDFLCHQKTKAYHFKG